MVLGLRLLWGELGLQTAMAVLLVAPEIFIPLRRAGAEFHASTEGQAAAPGSSRCWGHRSRHHVRKAVPPLPRPGAPVPTRAVPVPSPCGTWRSTTRVAAARHSGASHSRWRRGSRVALTGPSAAGKSTVLAALLCFVEPSGGTMTLNGLGPDDVGRRRVAVTVRVSASTPAPVPRHPGREPAPRARPMHPTTSSAGCSTRWASMSSSPPCRTDSDRPRARRPDPQRRRAPTDCAGPRPPQPGSRAPVGRAHRFARPPDRGPAGAGRRAVARGSFGLVAAHEPVLLPHFDSMVELRPLPAAEPLVAS